MIASANAFPVCAALLSAVILSACTGGVETRSLSEDDPSATSSSTTHTISGFVGSPSLADAEVRLVANGGVLAAATSSATGEFSLSTADALPLPIHLEAEGGSDLITGAANGKMLVAESFDAAATLVNVSHLSTLAAAMAACDGDLTEASLGGSWQTLKDHFGLPQGLNPDAGDPTPEDTAALMRADLMLAETQDRTLAALANAGTPASDADLTRALACDLAADGRLDTSRTGTDAVLIALYRSARAAVLLEHLAGIPYLAGSDASPMIDQALRRLSGDPDIRLADLPFPPVLLDQAGDDLAVLLADFTDAALLDLLLVLERTPTAAGIGAALTPGRLTSLWSLPERVALADSDTLDRLATRLASQPQATAPILSLSASRNSVNAGETVSLSWASGNADRCRAAGGWSGDRPLQGAATSTALTGATNFQLDCAGIGGISTESVQVSVLVSGQPPTVALTADAAAVFAGETTRLRWTSTNATSCTASGAWGGARAVLGDEQSPPITGDATFTLSCTGPDGSASDSVTVAAAPMPSPAPTLSFSASPGTITAGGNTTLSWSSSDASSCQASGSWSGSRAVSGTATVSPTATGTYTLTCNGAGGSISRSLTVNVNAAPAPSVSLNSTDSLVNSGSTATLTWSSTNATTCTASGAWSGSRATSGSVVVGPLSARSTFSLTCSGTGGNAVAMVAVSVNGPITLSWVAPTENVDGSPLTDLAGYRIYHGEDPRSYSGMTEVGNPDSTSSTITLPSGDHFVAMTALDAEGNESAYSNEVLKTAP